MKRAADGHEIKIGDVIIAKHALGAHKWVVHRVTKNYSFVKYNEHAEGKFPRILTWSFCSMPRQKWNTTDYEVWTK